MLLFFSLCHLELIGCVDTRSILILRLIITLICLAIFSSTIGFLLDALGPMRFGLKFMRRHAFWHILSGDFDRTSLVFTGLFRCSSSLYSHHWSVFLGVGADLRNSRSQSVEDRQKSWSSIRCRLLSCCYIQWSFIVRLGVCIVKAISHRWRRTSRQVNTLAPRSSWASVWISLRLKIDGWLVASGRAVVHRTRIACCDIHHPGDRWTSAWLLRAKCCSCVNKYFSLSESLLMNSDHKSSRRTFENQTKKNDSPRL